MLERGRKHLERGIAKTPLPLKSVGGAAGCIQERLLRPCSLALWIEVGEMQIDPCNVLTEKDPGIIFAIASRPMEIYRIILPGTGMGSDVKLR